MFGIGFQLSLPSVLAEVSAAHLAYRAITAALMGLMAIIVLIYAAISTARLIAFQPGSGFSASGSSYTY
jgi:hypothetical protein